MDLFAIAKRIEDLAKEKYGNTNKMVEASDGVLHSSIIYNMKREKASIPNIVVFQKIADLLETTTDYLLTGKKNNDHTKLLLVENLREDIGISIENSTSIAGDEKQVILELNKRMHFLLGTKVMQDMFEHTKNNPLNFSYSINKRYNKSTKPNANPFLEELGVAPSLISETIFILTYSFDGGKSIERQFTSRSKANAAANELENKYYSPLEKEKKWTYFGITENDLNYWLDLDFDTNTPSVEQLSRIFDNYRIFRNSKKIEEYISEYEQILNKLDDKMKIYKLQQDLVVERAARIKAEEKNKTLEIEKETLEASEPTESGEDMDVLLSGNTKK